MTCNLWNQDSEVLNSIRETIPYPQPSQKIHPYPHVAVTQFRIVIATAETYRHVLSIEMTDVDR